MTIRISIATTYPPPHASMPSDALRKLTRKSERLQKRPRVKMKIYSLLHRLSIFEHS